MSKDKLLADARKKATDAMQKEISELDTTKFAHEVVKMLTARKNDVIWKLLGLDNRWGQWDVDHCNGRQSKVTEYLAAETEPHIRAWVNDAVKDVLSKAATKEITAAMRKDVEQRYKETLRRSLMEGAALMGQRHAEEMLEDLKKELTLETDECEPA